MAASHPPTHASQAAHSPGAEHKASLMIDRQVLIPNSASPQDFFYVCPSHLKDRGFCSPIVDQAAIDAKKKQDMEAEVEKVKKEYEERQRKKKEESEKSKDKDKDKDKEKDGDDKKADDKKADESKDEKVRVGTDKTEKVCFSMQYANHVVAEG